MKLVNTRKVLVLSVPLVVLGFIGTRAACSQIPVDSARAARESALQDLLSSLDGGVPEEPPRYFKTTDGYLRFVGAPPSTDFPVDPNRRVTPQEAADAFLEEWRNLFVNVSPAVWFDRTNVVTRDSRSYVYYRQMYAGLTVRSAEIIVQVNTAGGIAAVMSDIVRDTEALGIMTAIKAGVALSSVRRPLEETKVSEEQVKKSSVLKSL